MNYITTYLRKIISRGYYSTIHLCGWIVLFCAVIRAINYTDIHEVDEDMPAIIRRGGDWGDFINAGLTQQSAYNTSSTSVPTVASKK